jgi:PHD/YefM family antitoxin component YafN of YafNO toxin-antitoxin module
MDIQESEPLSTFQEDPVPLLGHLKQTGRPIVLTVDGRAEVVVQDAESYERFRQVVDRAEAVVAVRKGIASMERGEGIPVDEAFEQLRRKHNLPRTS